MRLVDTSAWIEWLIASPTRKSVEIAMPERADWLGKHKLATADAIVYATALEYEADLLTCDTHFGALPGVTFIPKTGA